MLELYRKAGITKKMRKKFADEYGDLLQNKNVLFMDEVNFHQWLHRSRGKSKKDKKILLSIDCVQRAVSQRRSCLTALSTTSQELEVYYCVTEVTIYSDSFIKYLEWLKRVIDSTQADFHISHGQ